MRVEGDEAERVRFRRRLRVSLTEAERRLWYRLRDRRLAGFKFVRQEGIGPYVADFCCREERPIVEVDGGQHAESGHDRRRDVWLTTRGYRVLRFWNAEVLTNTAGVLDTILAALPPSARPKPGLPDFGFPVRILGKPEMRRGEGRAPLVGGEASPKGEGEGATSVKLHSKSPPHPRLPPRCDDDGVVTSLSPQAGRGGEHR